MEIEITNISPSFEIKSNEFDASQIADSDLFIEIGRDKFRFTIFSSSRNSFVWLEDYHIISILNENQALKAVKKIYQKHPFLAANYWKSIRIAIQSEYFTLLPEELYQPEDSTKYLQFASGKPLTDTFQIFDHKHSRLEMVNVFSIEKELLAWFKEMYTVKKILPMPMISTFIEGIFHSNRLNSLHILFEENYISLVYFRENKLIFCNRFFYRTPQDLTYHVLFVMNELGIVSDESVILYGEITSFSDTYELLSQSLSQLSFADYPSNLTFAPEFEDLPEHRYFNLFSLWFMY